MRSSLLLLSTALGLVTASPTDAAPSDDVIVVTGRYLSLDQVNAVKTPTPVLDVPQSLSIIGAEDIAAQGFTSIGDITRFTPGITISQGEGHRDAIVIRGNQTTADFFLDGIRDDVQYFRPLYNIEQVEVLRGANALLFGRGGGGGVINRVSKRPVLGEVFSTVTTSLDTFGAYDVSADVNAQAGAVGLRFNGYYRDHQNHRDVFDGESYAFNPTAAVEITPDTRLDLSYEYVDDDRIVDRGVPSVSIADGPDRPLDGARDTFFGSPDENLTTLEAHIVRARIDHTFSDMLRGNVTAQFADFDKLYQNLFAAGFDAGTGVVTLDGYQDGTDRQNLIVQGNLIAEFATGPLSHTLLVGAEYGNQDTANGRNDTVFADTGDDRTSFLFTDPLVIPAFGFSDRARDRESEVTFTSAYLQDQVDVTDWLKLVLGVRYDRFDITVLDRIEAENGAADGNDGRLGRVDEEISPRGGVILKPRENLSFYGSYSESFLPRSGDQFLSLSLTQEALDPQAFTNVEVGAKWDITSALSLTTALFRSEQESVTTVDPLDIGNSIILPGVVTDGAEVQLAGALFDLWMPDG